MKLRNQNGINMITLSIAITIMIIITSVLVYNTRDGVKVKDLNDMYNDIELINDKISTYYLEHNDIPKAKKYENLDFLSLADNNQINPNNGEDFYVIDLKSLDGITLNFGKDYDEVIVGGNVNSLFDLYIINEDSHTIYYPRGIDIQGMKYYTEPQEWQKISLLHVPQKLNSQLNVSNYGDFIDYGIDLSSQDEGHINGWKIFYANDKGTYIISADYVDYRNSILKTAISVPNANMENYTRYTGTSGYRYSVYWPAATYFTHTTTGTNTGDAIINSIAKSMFKYNFNGGMSNNNLKALAGLLDTNSWSGFLTDGATYAIGSPTIELYRASWNEKNYNEGNHTKIQISANETTGYYIGASNDDSFNPTTTSVATSTDRGYSDTLYYPHKNNFNNCNGYWIASPSAHGMDDVMYVNYNGDVMSGAYDYGFVGVRPVVFLPANIKATWDDTDNIWKIER